MKGTSEKATDMRGICRSDAGYEDLEGLRQLALALIRAASCGRLDGNGAHLRCRSERILSELDGMRAVQSDILMHQGLVRVFDDLLDGKLCNGIDDTARRHILSRRKEEQSRLDALTPHLHRLLQIRMELQELRASLPDNAIPVALPQGEYRIKGMKEKQQREGGVDVGNF